MALPDLDRLTGELFLFGHNSGIYSDAKGSFSVFLQYISIINLLNPTVTFFSAAERSLESLVLLGYF